MPRRHRRRFPTAALGGTGMLGLFLAIVLAGTVHNARNTISGTAYAAPEPAPTVHKGTPAQPGTANPAPAEPGAAPETANPAPAAPEPEAPRTRAPAAPRPQAAGTVRLAHGGTATLVRREVGIDGVLPIPNSLIQASWWGAELHAAAGATVLAGHVNWRGATGPFAELWSAKPGDPVSLVDQAGTLIPYRVSQVVTLGKDELPIRAEELFAQDGPHRLVLVTCGGRWVGGERGYASNQIAIAVPA
ncbi:MAG TPA: class F sortase [Actinophytocola sp.]|uniref:class F sortase n=1 Tax=Actinophytocola sp. TaxID=1872138 RepID=UPI002DFE51E8|nr:class F sortase [Actinophytocola sp.]